MQAIILSGGKGERLRPLTNDLPKCMVEVNEKPLAEYQIEWLVKYGITKIVFACGYLHEKIRDHFKDGSDFNVEICYSVEEEPLGRGGALKKAWSTISEDEPIVVTNGDVYSELELSKLIKVHNSKKVLASICLLPFKSPYGIVNFNAESIVESFEEKPVLPFWINGGIYILEPEIRDMLPNKGDHENEVFPRLAKEGKMYAYKSSEFWKGIDTIKDLNEFSGYLENKKAVK